MINIFVSYRREDSVYQAGRLYDRLVARFGPGRVFMDVDSIPLGADFREVLSERVAGCDVFIAIIGDKWLSVAGRHGLRRLDDPGDYVRIEIEAALSRNIPVIPVLVGQSPVPQADELPETMRALSFRNGLPVRPDPDFHVDMDRLIRGIEDGVSALRASPAPREIRSPGPDAEEAAPRAPMPGTDRDATAPPRQITNSIGMNLVLIPAGEFMMGSDDTDPDAAPEEFVDKAAGKEEKHRVRITRPFYLGTTEVTRGQFHRFVDEAGYQTEAEKDGTGGQGWNETTGEFEIDRRYTWQDVGFEQTDEHPVINVTWTDATAFCEWLSQKEGRSYRLPTEAEWEYACRAGTTTRYSFWDESQVGEYAWFAANAGRRTHPVGQKLANRWGLFDMHGNVWEWCRDGFAADYYQWSPTDDPQGADGASAPRVIRGGSWADEPPCMRAAYRLEYHQGHRRSFLGFRCGEFPSVR